MSEVTVVIATIGSEKLLRAINSVLTQSVASKVLLVIDGPKYEDKVMALVKPLLDHPLFRILVLPENTGQEGYYGHRIYAAASFLINTPYMAYLDEDNTFESNHIANCLALMQNEPRLDWVYSLRKIIFANDVVVLDDAESIGPYTQTSFVDTNCYFLKTSVAYATAAAFYGKFGQDRLYFDFLCQNFPNYISTANFTLNYYLDDRDLMAYCQRVQLYSEYNIALFNGNPPWRTHQLASIYNKPTRKMEFCIVGINDKEF